MNLFRKILCALLLISLLPLLVSSFILSGNLTNIRETLSARLNEGADRQASENLRMRAEQVAADVTNFLEGCEADLTLLAALPRSPEVLKSFYFSRKGEIWHRRLAGSTPHDIHEWIPRYSSLEFTDRNGQQICVIRSGKMLSRLELRNVANPAATEYGSENYFRRTRQLPRGEIYVSHLTGFHLSKNDQLAGVEDPESAHGGREYRGVVRFSTPLFDRNGSFDGIAVLSLDHRHLMEFSQHINPGATAETVFPSYKSGNYAFMFDDEGWIITHPKFWDIRGLDKSGRLVPPYTSRSVPADVRTGRIPFNLDHAGFVHPNYPVVARMVREGKSGAVDITNVGGAKKIMAFAPIRYRTGDYRRHGIFGGMTIGFQADQFHETARAGISLMNRQLEHHIRTSMILIACTSLMVVICAWFLSRGITRPLAQLTEGARSISGGAEGNRVKVSTNDELGELSRTFNRMAEELDQRKNNLMQTLGELQASREEIMQERNFKESILDSISSAILTFSPEGTLTSVNGTGRRFLGDAVVLNAHYTTIFNGWEDMGSRLAAVLAGTKGYGREPFTLQTDQALRHFEIGFFPIGAQGCHGITVTMRDETERERMRDEMTRMDRLASLGRLSAGIAHEVRNPLTGVSLLLDDLHDRPAIDTESRQLIGKALEEIERVERLVASLLAFSLPSRTEFRTADLNNVLQDTLLLMRRECERQHTTLEFHAGEVPRFRFDVEKIRQATLNLVKNALQAMPDGGTISVTTTSGGECATIAVADSGPGIHPDDLPLIFEPFFTRKGAGTGLGLSITQQIVEEHHGTIAVESVPREGTVIRIALPLST